ncbi:hypothetical protein SBOR_0646 [Sclerotinia borealis F-4128]|uniref:Uncharacterized protein n=1 Tax=Sclerotinia borealis (strain F-4128) TaxID=1432307 RepID=W9CS94_SCLBF|nr:hypothetical protein SBOR_0646 [Sclerotinia borealis F-4128]
MDAPSPFKDIPAVEILKKSIGDRFGAIRNFSYLGLGCDAPHAFDNFGCIDKDIWGKTKSKGKMEETFS